MIYRVWNASESNASHGFILTNSPFYYNFCFFSCSHSPLAFDDPRSSKGDCGLPCEDVCVREGDSFRCDCSEVGKFLQSDGISCRSKCNGMAAVIWLFSRSEEVRITHIAINSNMQY